jgi:predicted DNA-binding transcriptional regulator
MVNILDLRKIGLTDGEIRVYAALLETGETTRTTLAKKSGISPSKIYDVANRLAEKGIVSVVRKHGAMHFSAANPTRLKDFVDRKQLEIEGERKVVGELLPSLLARYGETKGKQDVEVFYGWDGMRTVFWDIAKALGKGDRNYVFGASMGLDWKQADLFFSKYYREIEKKGYSTHIIFNENMRNHPDRTRYFHSSPRHSVRYLYQDTFTEINFYKDTVLFIMLLKKPMVVRIRNKEAADSCMKFFQSIWKQAKA